MGSLDGDVALVTGAARGQGEAIARMFVAQGSRVVLADILDAGGTAVAVELGDAAAFVHLDVTSSEQWNEAVSRTSEIFGKLTVLVNNAGIHRRGTLDEMSLQEYEHVVAVNQTGCWLGMKAVAGTMRDAGGGAIVNTSSIAGKVGMAGRTAYVASKFAIRGMTKAAALELGPSGIRVNSVYPGAIDTSMMSRSDEQRFTDLPIPRAGTADEVAKLVTFLASGEASYCTGSEFTVDGGRLAG